MVQSKPSAMSEDQFCVVMYILHSIKKGATVPDSLPECFKSLVGGVSSAASTPRKPMSPPAEKSTTQSSDVDWTPDDSVVNKLKAVYQKKANGADTIPVASAVKLFQKSGVEMNDIGKICKLVVGGKPTSISESQFVVIMIIIQQVHQGAAVPSMLPPQLQRLL
ncbi:hypothetical protein WA158_001473 [Blastocystis sp. Blastoise]